MTAGRDALRAGAAELLADVHSGWCGALRDHPSPGPCICRLKGLAEGIERFAAEQVAAALNDAADEEDAKAVAVGIRLDRCIPPGNWLRARAAAVLAAPDSGDDQR